MTPGDPATRLTVAGTGATGEIGRPFVRRLERTPGVGSIRAMARRPFDPGEHGWTRAEFTEDTPPVGTEHFYYSAQKAELEAALRAAVQGTGTQTYVFRPPFVGGPDAHALMLILPHVRMASALPEGWPAGWLPRTAHVLPDFGVPLQIVHVEDVTAALCTAVAGAGRPGVYNLAAPGQLTMSDIAAALGWRAVRLPRSAIGTAAQIHRRLPWAPSLSDWIQTLPIPVIMSTGKAERELAWRATHDAHTTLRQTVASARAARLRGLD